jgi:hypothetical protein
MRADTDISTYSNNNTQLLAYFIRCGLTTAHLHAPSQAVTTRAQLLYMKHNQESRSMRSNDKIMAMHIRL